MNDRILIVEDDPEISGFLQTGLAADGYEVEVTSHGGDLAQRLRDGGFGLVILDRMLPTPRASTSAGAYAHKAAAR